MIKSFALRSPSIVYLLLVSCIISACRNNSTKVDLKNASPYFTYLLTENEEAVFRGIDFNKNADDVKKIEKAKLYETTTDHLFYEVSFPKDSTQFAEYANVQYFFNENNQLDIIIADVFLADTLQENKLKNTLSTYFNQKFESVESKEFDYPVWSAEFDDKKTDKTYNYTITLKDLSEDIGVTIEYIRE